MLRNTFTMRTLPINYMKSTKFFKHKKFLNLNAWYAEKTIFKKSMETEVSKVLGMLDKFRKP